MDAKRINELRHELEQERISYGEIAEIYTVAGEMGITITDEMVANDVLDEIEEAL